MIPKKTSKIILIAGVIIALVTMLIFLVMSVNKTTYIPTSEITLRLTLDAGDDVPYKLILPIPLTSDGVPSLILSHLKVELGNASYNVIESNISTPVNNKKALEINGKGKLTIVGSYLSEVENERIEIFHHMSLANHSKKYGYVTVWAYLETNQAQSNVTLSYQIHEQTIYEHCQINDGFRFVNELQNLQVGWQEIYAELFSSTILE